MLRSDVARAAVCGPDRLEQEEVALSIDRPPHSCESCTEGWQFVLCKAALVTDLPLYARPSFTCPSVSSAMLPTDYHRKEGCILGTHFFRGHTEMCFLPVSIGEGLCWSGYLLPTLALGVVYAWPSQGPLLLRNPIIYSQVAQLVIALSLVGAHIRISEWMHKSVE